MQQQRAARQSGGPGGGKGGGEARGKAGGKGGGKGRRPPSEWERLTAAGSGASLGEVRSSAQLAQALAPRAGGAAHGADAAQDEAALAAQLQRCTGAELRQELRRRVAALASAEGRLPPPS